MEKQHLTFAISAVLLITGTTGCNTAPHLRTHPNVVVHYISLVHSSQDVGQTNIPFFNTGTREFASQSTYPRITHAIYNHQNRSTDTAAKKETTPHTLPSYQKIKQSHAIDHVIPAVQFMKINAFEREVNRLYATDKKIVRNVQQTSRNSLWARIISGYRLKDDTEQTIVQNMLDRHLRNPKQLNRVFKRSGKYLHFILHELNRRKLPTELALLPMVESAYNNKARSRTGAVGLWQLTAREGQHLGLRQTRNYDARMDVFASTQAVLNKLQRLNRIFKGDWKLTLAAYKAGQPIVQRELMKNRYNHKPTDYWHLTLPKKTLNYLSELLAYREILLRPHAYGLTLPTVTNTPQVMQVVVNKSVDLHKVAKIAGLPTSLLANLNLNFKNAITNPSFSRKVVLPRANAVKLHRVIRQQPATTLAFYPPKTTLKH